MDLLDVKGLKMDYGPDMGDDETIHIFQPLLRHGEVEMTLLSSLGEPDDGWETLRTPIDLTRKVTLYGSDPWPPELKKGTKVEISAVLAGVTCVVKGVVTKRYVRKLVLNGTLELVE